MTMLIMPVKQIKKMQSKNAEEILARLQRYLDGNLEEPMQILCGFWKDQQNVITYQELREVVKKGLLDESIYQSWSRDYSKMIANKWKPILENAMQAGSISQPLIGELPFTFRLQTPHILNWIEKRGAAFVTSSSIEQRQAIQALLAQKVLEKHTVDELARFLRPCIGLTEVQAKANLRYYDNIVTTLKKEHPRMKLENIQKKARDAAAKYAERQHRQRAMTIAQTETAFAYNRGADEAIRQAQSQNLIGIVKKRWCTSGDDHVCSICQALEGMEIEMDKEFPFKGRKLFQGQDLLPPAHPRCACAVEYIEMESVNAIHSTSLGETENYISELEIQENDFGQGIINDFKEKAKIISDNTTRMNPPLALCELEGRHAKNINEIIKNSPEHYRKIILANSDKILFLKTNALGPSRFDDIYNGIFINFSKDRFNVKGEYATTFHEMGHNIDKLLNRISQNGVFGNLLKTDAESFLLEYAKINGYNKEESLRELSDAIKKAPINQVHIISDLFSGIYGGEYKWRYLHEDSYWSKKGKLEREAFAHFFSASVLEDSEKLKNIKIFFPSAYRWFDELMKEVAWYE